MINKKLLLFICGLFIAIIHTNIPTLAQVSETASKEDTTIIQWIANNYQWLIGTLFSGIGVAALAVFFNRKQNNSSKQKANSGDRSSINQAGGSITNNAPNNYASPNQNNSTGNLEDNINAQRNQQATSENNSPINQAGGDIVNYTKESD